MTNEEKFKEVFGLDPDLNACPLAAKYCNDNIVSYCGPGVDPADRCKYFSFWTDEYKEVK